MTTKSTFKTIAVALIAGITISIASCNKPVEKASKPSNTAVANKAAKAKALREAIDKAEPFVKPTGNIEKDAQAMVDIITDTVKGKEPAAQATLNAFHEYYKKSNQVKEFDDKLMKLTVAKAQAELAKKGGQKKTAGKAI